jgi:anti-anti-sigma regulatory factor
MRPFQHIYVDEIGPVFCVRLKDPALDDEALEQMTAELARLIDEAGCAKMVLSLGPREVPCLYSLLLAKLIYLQRRLEAGGGGLALAQVTPHVRELFALASLERHFRFFPDQASAVAALQ